jgi:hypothetical protein
MLKQGKAFGRTIRSGVRERAVKSIKRTLQRKFGTSSMTSLISTTAISKRRERKRMKPRALIIRPTLK